MLDPIDIVIAELVRRIGEEGGERAAEAMRRQIEQEHKQEAAA